ncbi:hypothetical protein BBF96_06555 [Anoxybacter fermentans]|uniref:ABC transmembrane type-1 domain-containing protein n=1 Tax=Anoxybacter fermentans TaxID=1323375 RepID=A0A3Q9HQE6_9FIRM|nr:ABC transporter ATP-binding protein [Anoxybacter fermentans]AZR73074.1 hypothetical protein BBF96_06555 [Anoxybacter fermentans]
MITDVKVVKRENIFNLILNLKEMITFMKEWKIFLALSVFEILRGFFMVQGQAWGIKWITNGCVQHDGDMLLWGIILLVGTVSLSTLFVYLIDYTSLKIIIKTKSDLRKKMIKSVINLRPIDLNLFDSGDLIYRLTNNVNDVSELYRAVYFFIGSFGKVSGSLVVGFILSWQLSITIILLGILKIWLDKTVIKKLQDIIKKIKAIESDLVKEVLEYIRGSFFFRIFGNEERIINQFRNVNEKFNEESIKEAKIDATTNVIMKLF